jgi:hypothetical protein
MVIVITAGSGPTQVYTTGRSSEPIGPDRAGAGGEAVRDPEFGMPERDDVPTDPDRVESAQASGGEAERQSTEESAGEASRDDREVAASADSFDRLRAELRRRDDLETVWRHRRPWRWLMGWRRKPGKDPRP